MYTQSHLDSVSEPPQVTTPKQPLTMLAVIHVLSGASLARPSSQRTKELTGVDRKTGSSAAAPVPGEAGSACRGRSWISHILTLPSSEQDISSLKHETAALISVRSGHTVIQKSQHYCLCIRRH